jgi:microcystin degradation protein MlrC
MPFHVLTGAFVHESNTFKKGETTLQDFRDDVLDLGQAAIDRFGDVNDELAGFWIAGRAAGWQVTHTVSAHATPGARVSREAFDHIAGIICDAAGNIGHAGRHPSVAARLDGAQLLRGRRGRASAPLRAIVGPDLPIAVTLDLHAMVTPAMVDQAQILVSYKTYPHVDMRVTGRHAARSGCRRCGCDPPAHPARPSPDAGRGQRRAHRRARNRSTLCPRPRA